MSKKGLGLSWPREGRYHHWSQCARPMLKPFLGVSGLTTLLGLAASPWFPLCVQSLLILTQLLYTAQSHVSPTGIPTAPLVGRSHPSIREQSRCCTETGSPHFPSGCQEPLAAFRSRPPWCWALSCAQTHAVFLMVC